MTNHRTGEHSIAVLALLAGAAMWGVVWYPMRLLEAAGLSGLWLTLLIYVAAWAAGLIWAASQQRTTQWLLPAWLRLWLLALAAGWTNVAFVLAVLDGNVMRVLLLFYLSPVWAVLLGWLALREHISRVSWAMLSLAMAGALLMLWNPEIGAPWPHSPSDWFALSSGMAFAISNMMVRKTHDIVLAEKVSISWQGVILVTLLLMLSEQAPVPALQMAQLGGVAALGVFGIAVMTTLVQYGVTHMPVHRSAVILLFELVAGAVSQQLLTDEIMTVREWCGGALIIAAAWVSARCR